MVAGNDEGIENVEWENLIVEARGGLQEHLSKLKVNGGHLYRQAIVIHDNPTVSLCFVPDVDLSRYKAHLRDAYRQGYNDGQSDAKVGCRADLEL